MNGSWQKSEKKTKQNRGHGVNPKRYSQPHTKNLTLDIYNSFFPSMYLMCFCRYQKFCLRFWDNYTVNTFATTGENGSVSWFNLLFLTFLASFAIMWYALAIIHKKQFFPFFPSFPPRWPLFFQQGFWIFKKFHCWEKAKQTVLNEQWGQKGSFYYRNYSERGRYPCAHFRDVSPVITIYIFIKIILGY